MSGFKTLLCVYVNGDIFRNGVHVGRVFKTERWKYAFKNICIHVDRAAVIYETFVCSVIMNCVIWNVHVAILNQHGPVFFTLTGCQGPSICWMLSMRTLAHWHSAVAGLTVWVKPNTWWHWRTCVTWASSTRTHLCATLKAVTRLSLNTPSYWSQPVRRWSAEATITKTSAHQFLKISLIHMFMLFKLLKGLNA